MADHPRYPETEDEMGADREPGVTAKAGPWRTYAIAAVVVVLVLVFVVLHLTGTIGPGVHEA